MGTQKKTMESLEQALGAAVGGGIATFSLYPLDNLRTKLAVSTRPGDTALKTVQRVLETQGVLGLFSGVPMKLIQSMLGKFLYFLWYTTLLNRWAILQGAPLSTPQALVCGYLAEAMHLPFTLPFEVITTRIQKGDTKLGIWGTVKSVLAEGGAWRGWRVYVYLCCMPAIQFVLFDRLKSFSGEPLSSGKAFVLGAMARAVAVSLTYPFTRAKAIVQTQKAKSDDKKAAKSKSVIGLLQALIREEG